MKRLAVSSFAFRYNIGFDGFEPPRRLSTAGFLERAHALGFQGVQLCENLGILKMTQNELTQIRELARKLGLFIEVGMNGAEKDNLEKHLGIALSLSSNFLRVVLGGRSCKKNDEIAGAVSHYIDTIRSVLPLFKSKNIQVGIENHFDLPTPALRKIVDTINDNNLGLILDTTNCIHFLERPEEALEICRGRIVSVHLKDYCVKKVEAGHFISGTVLMDGELNVQLFLDCCENIVMEMTVRRPENYTPDQVVEWEDQAVAASARKLMSCLNQ